MSRRHVKATITGSHSTGKSTFLSLLASRLEARGFRVATVSDVASAAMDLGFPILTGHTYESTCWIMAEGLRREAEASLSADVVLVDRPTLDALGYLQAALQVSARTIDPARMRELRTLAENHMSDYDVVVVTTLDPTIPLGHDRDPDLGFRAAAAASIDALVSAHAPQAIRLTSSGSEDVLAQVQAVLEATLSRRRGAGQS